MTTLFLPWPPSTNTLFSGKARRFKSDGYKAWLTDAYAEYLQQKTHVKKHTGKVRISLSLKAPTKARSDIDNRIKSVLDFLVTHQVIVDDDSRYVQSVYAEWKEMDKACCFVIIEDCEK